MNGGSHFTKGDLMIFCFLGTFLLIYNLICFILRKKGIKISKKMLRMRGNMENPVDLLQIVVAFVSIVISVVLLNVFFGM